MDDSYDELPWSPHPDTVAWLKSLPLPPGRSAPALPTSRQDWELVERYRLLVTSINHVAQWENARLQQEKQQWDQRTEALAPQVAQLNLAPSATLDELAEAHGRLPLPLPPQQSTSSVPTQHSLASFIAALEELEESVTALNLEVAETRNLQQSLDEEAAKRAEHPNELFAEHSKQNMEAAQKLDKAVAVLAKKSVEYQERLTDLRKRVPAGYEGIVGQLKDRSVEYDEVNSARSKLKNKLAAFGDLPSDYGQAKVQLDDKKREIKGLRKTRDKLLSQIGAGVA